MNRHIPVLLQEVIQAFSFLENKEHSSIVDGTLGGGGHSAALLRTYKNLSILGLDQDVDSLKKTSESLTEEFKNRFHALHLNFSNLHESKQTSLLASTFAPPWDGYLLDLGYSSNQLEDPTYGMSFQTEGPLDMRLFRGALLNQTVPTAWDLISESTEKELVQILKVYGEVQNPKKTAVRIKEALQDGTLTNSTRSLAHLMEKIDGKSFDSIHPATLVFQALRIAVNDELRVLDTFLKHAILNLKVGGKIAVISFHSLEDRIVKYWGQAETKVKPLTKKPIEASSEEIKLNPRSRSAKLRIYEKIQ